MRRTTFPRLARVIANLIAGAIAALLGFGRPAMAGSVQFQLGDQDFADGMTPVFSSQIRAAGAGEAYPFDGTLFGSDVVRGALGAFDFTHTFNLNGGKPVSAKLTIGLIDVDSTPEQPLDTVGVLFEGVSQPTEMLRGISASGAKSSVEVVEIPVPLEYLSSTGTLHVSVVARQAGYGNLGNAIEPDFSRLTVETAADSIRPPTDGGGLGGNDGGGSIDPTPVPPSPNPGPGPNPVPLPPVLAPAGLILLALAGAPEAPHPPLAAAIVSGPMAMDLPTLRKLVSLDPNDPLSRFALGKKLFETGSSQDELSEAAEHLTFANEHAPEHLATYHILGQTLIKLGRNADAQRVLEAGVERTAGIGEGMGRDLGPAMQALLESLS